MKGILITGATSGIGHQLALDYANSGWRVIACGRNQTALKELSASHEHIDTRAFDVTELTQVHQALESLPWVPDVWLLNAGNCEYIDDGVMDAALFERVMKVNVIGLVYCLEAIQRHFLPGQQLVLVGSIASEMALPRAEAYGASKAAVSYLARTLAVDLAPKGITVSTVYPGFVDTPLTQKNDFSMPMMISVEQASAAIRQGIEQRKLAIYCPKRFTALLRLLALLPYRWQKALAAKLSS
ncbi:SDR family NAD(P)-dependent oxidoreductase [Vibrio sp. SM6]|uniref:SDR family NAD(P)-dependent oxidoreductase n=1 Tax=Vibrio agarilyticus TaxID=2726741 RepID=A0A7X8TMV0_9VIBR|nr:SDR family NAD(P)-dependent oxidoreductase [Vibrio agarilyticus]NLS11459.1 SDR family NAD(P)-dependent oxidoreductase [Vibrio agarilyticus]